MHRAVTRRILAAGIAAAVMVVVAGVTPAAAPALSPTAVVRAAIGALAVGEPVRFENLAIFPLSWKKSELVSAAASSSFATLDQALKKGWLRIREMDDGDVPRLVVDNRSDRTVFVLGGEVVTGGKQDRLIRGDVLVRPRARGVVIPVYCVEAGRWTQTSAQFSTRQNLGTWQLRANAQAAAPSAQESIWGEVEKMQAKAGARSDTSAYQDIYEDTRVNARLESLEKALKSSPRLTAGTAGVLCAVGKEVVALDVFADASLFERLWPKILRAAALASVTEDAAGSTSRGEALAFLWRLSDSAFTEARGVDQGTEVHANDGAVTAGALVHEGGLVHLAAFPRLESQASPPRGRE